MSAVTRTPSLTSAAPGTFGTFQGVFRPTILTILGAMLYLREGWLVGNGGLLGALAIILLAHVITGITALSLASIATNVRVRPGGAFAIIAQALGLEAGGAIGLPLFIAQAASAAMYLYAFSEAWLYLFPTHDPRLVAGLAFLGVGALAWTSASLAFRAQAVMMVVVVVALSSALLGWFRHETVTPTLAGDFSEASWLAAFAIFFPACTGVMVGVGMSGNLADPRRSLPVGTLAAWGTGLAVYTLFAFWYATIATPQELTTNMTVIVDRALFGPLVLIGLLTSTSMAALSTLVSAPRLLHAMAEQRVVPWGEQISRTAADGEPRRALLVALGVAAAGLLTGSLNAIAPIITSFFIVTYLAINLVVLLEQQLGMISFRPTFRVPVLVPLVGVVVCLLALTLASPFGGLVEIALVVGLYGWLMRRKLVTPWETVRSGIAVTLAEWVARRVADVEKAERAWKPDLLIPMESPEDARELLPLVATLTRGRGSAKLVAMGKGPELSEGVEALGRKLRADGVYTSWSRLSVPVLEQGASLALDAMEGAFFPPNLVLVDASRHDEAALQALRESCKEARVGLVLLLPHQAGGIGPGRGVAVWLSDRSPDWELRLHLGNLDLPVLVGWLLASAGRGPMHLHTVIRDEAEVRRARRFLEQLVDGGRLPSDTRMRVSNGDFLGALQSAPPSDVHLFGMPEHIELGRMRQIQEATGGSACLYLLDSGRESVLA